ncbi:MAG: transketolase, partial [Ornithinimicrobium sp.]
RELVGDAGRIVSLDHFGASADYERLYEEFGITADAVAQAARDSISAAQAHEGPTQGPLDTDSPDVQSDESNPTGDAASGGDRSTDATQK